MLDISEEEFKSKTREDIDNIHRFVYHKQENKKKIISIHRMIIIPII